MQTHPEAAETIYTKQKEINEEWTQLTAKANARKEKLLDSYDLQRFLADYRYVAVYVLLENVLYIHRNRKVPFLCKVHCPKIVVIFIYM